MNKVGLTRSGSVLVEMSQVEFEALRKFTGEATEKGVPDAPVKKSYPRQADAVTGVSGDKMTLKQAVDYCAPRLVKLAPKKKTAVLNGIRAMFNFQGGVSEERAEKIYQALQNKGVFFDREGKIEYSE